MNVRTGAAALRTLLIALAPAIAGLVHAQETWPSRPITLIVPFPPGGAGDIVARPLANQLDRLFKQPVIVTNRPGAAGAIGTAAAAASKPDGYTLLVTISSFSTVPEVDALFKRPQAFTREQFIPIARLTADPPLLVANPAAQWSHGAQLHLKSNRYKSRKPQKKSRNAKRGWKDRSRSQSRYGLLIGTDLHHLGENALEDADVQVLLRPVRLA